VVSFIVSRVEPSYSATENYIHCNATCGFKTPIEEVEWET